MDTTNTQKDFQPPWRTLRTHKRASNHPERTLRKHKRASNHPEEHYEQTKGLPATLKGHYEHTKGLPTTLKNNTNKQKGFQPPWEDTTNTQKGFQPPWRTLRTHKMASNHPERTLRTQKRLPTTMKGHYEQNMPEFPTDFLTTYHKSCFKCWQLPIMTVNPHLTNCLLLLWHCCNIVIYIVVLAEHWLFTIYYCQPLQ